MSSKKERIIDQPKSLACSEGRSLIMEDEKGQLRYVYEDASLDYKSTVDGRTPHILISGPATAEDIEASAKSGLRIDPQDIGEAVLRTYKRSEELV